ncbi:MAG: hypothetical protein IPF93_18445 [Saprospiraceae bacterium]|nr:hypothetical protein [Saprospiraceae bacterium]
MKKCTLQIILLCCIGFSSYGQWRNGAGPQTPSCGIVEVKTNEMIAGQQFPKGQYQINVIGMSCEEVMGDEGLFSKFLQLGDNDLLPEPWSYLKGAVGAPKFVKRPGVGFRVERVADSIIKNIK